MERNIEHYTETYEIDQVVFDVVKSEVDKPESTDFSYSKYYACLVPLGHAEDGYVIWAIMPVIAKSPEEARRVIREVVPHVKDDKPYTIAGLMEITNTEYKVLKAINDFDAYLFSQLPPNDPLVIARRMMIPENEARIARDCHKMEEIISGKKRYGLKFAEDFPYWMVLQRALAPVIKNGQLEHGKVDMFPLVREYLTATIKHIVIDGNYPIRNMEKHGTDEQLTNAKAEILLRYCKLFGKDNPLGIIYNAKYHTLKYPVEGQRIFPVLEIPQPNDYEAKIWNSRCPAKYSERPRRAYQIPKDMTPEEFDEYAREHKPNMPAKFAAREAKRKTIQEKTK